jgi:hypothetical protein
MYVCVCVCVCVYVCVLSTDFMTAAYTKATEIDAYTQLVELHVLVFN